MVSTPEQRLVARTILLQLGGGARLEIMAGLTHHFITTDGDLILYFKASRRANIAKIKLNWKDLYDIEFYKVEISTAGEAPVHNDLVVHYQDIYAENLREIFESATGLRITL